MTNFAGAVSATLQSQSAEQLNKVAIILKACPTVRLTVGGYTDNTGGPRQQDSTDNYPPHQCTNTYALRHLANTDNAATIYILARACQLLVRPYSYS